MHQATAGPGPGIGSSIRRGSRAGSVPQFPLLTMHRPRSLHRQHGLVVAAAQGWEPGHLGSDLAQFTQVPSCLCASVSPPSSELSGTSATAVSCCGHHRWVADAERGGCSPWPHRDALSTSLLQEGQDSRVQEAWTAKEEGAGTPVRVRPGAGPGWTAWRQSSSCTGRAPARSPH